MEIIEYKQGFLRHKQFALAITLSLTPEMNLSQEFEQLPDVLSNWRSQRVNKVIAVQFAIKAEGRSHLEAERFLSGYVAGAHASLFDNLKVQVILLDEQNNETKSYFLKQ